MAIGRKMYHIRFLNKTGYDIIHLQYSRQDASVLLRNTKIYLKINK